MAWLATVVALFDKWTISTCVVVKGAAEIAL